MKSSKNQVLLSLGVLTIALFIFFRNTKTGLDEISSIPADKTASQQKNQALDDSFQDQIDPDSLAPDLQVKKLSDAYIISGPDDKRILRFPGTFANTGDGPLELVGTSDQGIGTTRAVQRICKKNGTKNERFVGDFVFHSTHDHWHFEDFVEFEILSLKENSESDQRLLGTGKVTYCLHDYAPLPEAFAGKPEKIVYPWCGSSADIQGISVGWVDTYLADVPGQELDVTDLPDGTYAFRSVVDPENRIAEKDENNNNSITLIKITGNTVEILSDPPS